MSRYATLVLAALVAGCHPATSVQTATVARRALVVPILADGTLEPPAGGEVRAPEGGVIGAVLVREGDRVARGAALVRLDNPDLDQRLLASRAEAAQLGEEQQRSAAEADAARRDRDHLAATLDADARLVKSGAITAEQQRSDRLTYEQTSERARNAERRVADLVHRRQLADDATRSLESRAAQHVVRAPAEGIVYNLPRAGESVAAGQLIATVADPNHVRVRARVDAPDLPRVHSGQRLIVTFDGLPNRQWEGSIVLVPPGLREVAAREVGEVIGEIHGDATGLPANASVNVEIVVGEKPAALVIPRGALQREGVSRFAFVFADGKAKRTPVTVGLIGPNDVEVLTGLKEGDRVILPGATPVQDGQAVQ